MAKRATPQGKRVKVEGLTLYVEEWSHAYLVRGPGLRGGTLTINVARRAVFEFLGRKKWTKVAAMPCRPFCTRELGEEPSCSAVAFYFNIGPRCDSPSCGFCSRVPKDRYKP